MQLFGIYVCLVAEILFAENREIRSSFIVHKDVEKLVLSSRVSNARQKVMKLIERVLVTPALPGHFGVSELRSLFKIRSEHLPDTFSAAT
jgi:hypothetical protein